MVNIHWNMHKACIVCVHKIFEVDVTLDNKDHALYPEYRDPWEKTNNNHIRYKYSRIYDVFICSRIFCVCRIFPASFPNRTVRDNTLEPHKFFLAWTDIIEANITTSNKLEKFWSSSVPPVVCRIIFHCRYGWPAPNFAFTIIPIL